MDDMLAVLANLIHRHATENAFASAKKRHKVVHNIFIQMITLGRKLKIDINTQGNTQGCTFARIEIHEPLNASAKYLFKICIVDIAPRFLEDGPTHHVQGVVYPAARTRHASEQR